VRNTSSSAILFCKSSSKLGSLLWATDDTIPYAAWAADLAIAMISSAVSGSIISSRLTADASPWYRGWNRGSSFCNSSGSIDTSPDPTFSSLKLSELSDISLLSATVFAIDAAFNVALANAPKAAFDAAFEAILDAIFSSGDLSESLTPSSSAVSESTCSESESSKSSGSKSKLQQVQH
jgi:hypothetical protein